MSKQHSYPELNLFFKGRISESDAARQSKTISEIRDRLTNQPGLILADEVGMGKTFVALGVAISTFWNDPERRSVVIMVPAGILPKWERDFATFKANCVVDPDLRKSLFFKSAKRGEEFLRAVDDPEHRRPAVIFLTHNAMHLGLNDPWIRWAITYKALKGRHNTDRLKRALARFGPRLFQSSTRFGTNLGQDEEIWFKLLSTRPEEWTRILIREYKNGVFGADAKEDEIDDLIPLDLLRVLDQLETGSLYEALLRLVPERESDSLNERISQAWAELKDIYRGLWDTLIKKLALTMPLLIMDEAHHLKNSDTKTAGLLQSEIEAKGHLSNIFDRMLFLTATPFQLGHHELVQVLSRFRAIRWDAAPRLSGQSEFEAELAVLLDQLDSLHGKARRFQKEWAKIKPEEFAPSELQALFSAYPTHPDPESGKLKLLQSLFLETKAAVRLAEVTLRKWVIRHLRDRTLPGAHSGKLRR